MAILLTRCSPCGYISNVYTWQYMIWYSANANAWEYWIC